MNAKELGLETDHLQRNQPFNRGRGVLNRDFDAIDHFRDLVPCFDYLRGRRHFTFAGFHCAAGRSLARRLHLGGALFRIEGSNAMAMESDVSVIVWIDGKFVKDGLFVIASDTKTIMRKPRPAVTCQITETD
jgi:hypothetical protein